MDVRARRALRIIVGLLLGIAALLTSALSAPVIRHDPNIPILNDDDIFRLLEVAARGETQPPSNDVNIVMSPTATPKTIIKDEYMDRPNTHASGPTAPPNGNGQHGMRSAPISTASKTKSTANSVKGGKKDSSASPQASLAPSPSSIVKPPSPDPTPKASKNQQKKELDDSSKPTPSMTITIYPMESSSPVPSPLPYRPSTNGGDTTPKESSTPEIGAATTAPDAVDAPETSGPPKAASINKPAKTPQPPSTGSSASPNGVNQPAGEPTTNGDTFIPAENSGEPESVESSQPVGPNFAKIMPVPTPKAGREIVIFPITVKKENGARGISKKLDVCIRTLSAKKTGTTKDEWALVGVTKSKPLELEARYAGSFKSKDPEAVKDFQKYCDTKMSKDILASCGIGGVSISGSGAPVIAAIGTEMSVEAPYDNRVAIGASFGALSVVAIATIAVAIFFGRRRRGPAGATPAPDHMQGLYGVGSERGLRYTSNRDDESSVPSMFIDPSSPEAAGDHIPIREIPISQEGDTVESDSFTDPEGGSDDGGSLGGYSEEIENAQHEDESESVLPDQWDEAGEAESDEDDYSASISTREDSDMIPFGARGGTEHPHDYIIGMGPVSPRTPLPPNDYVVPDLGRQD